MPGTLEEQNGQWHRMVIAQIRQAWMQWHAARKRRIILQMWVCCKLTWEVRIWVKIAAGDEYEVVATFTSCYFVLVAGVLLKRHGNSIGAVHPFSSESHHSVLCSVVALDALGNWPAFSLIECMCRDAYTAHQNAYTVHQSNNEF